MTCLHRRFAVAALVAALSAPLPALAQNAGATAQPAQKQDPHAGHNHGAADPKIATGKPGQDPPKPTVVLKEGEKPGIKFDEPTYDFGRIRAGGDVQHEYWFTNTGNGPLEILQVKPSCGCTVAGEFTRIVQPGETGKVPVKLSTKNATGPMSKSIRVSTNIEGADSTVTLQIKGEVWQPIEVTPRTVAFGRVTADQAETNLVRKVTIVNNLDGQMTLGPVTSSNPAFNATITPLEDGKKYEMSVTMVPPVKTGNNTGQLTMTTGIADMPNLSVSVYAFIVAPIEVSPARVTLTPGRTDAQTVHMYLRSNLNKPFKVSELKASDDAIKLELTDVKDSQTYRLKVEIPAGFKPSQSDQITLKTDDATVPSITIPIVEMSRPTAAVPAHAPNTGGTFTPPSQAGTARPAQPSSAAQASHQAAKPGDTRAAPAPAGDHDKAGQ